MNEAIDPSDSTQPAPTKPAQRADQRRQRRRRRFALVVVILAITLPAAAGEVFVRWRYPIVDPRPYFNPGIYRSEPPPVSWELLPNYVGQYHQQTTPVKVTTNELAMRDPPLTDARRGAKRRVLLLGDSVTFGRGVADEDTFARRLEEVLPGSAVFNAGVSGYDTRQELHRLLRVGPEIKPHLVVLGWYRNDVIVPSNAVAAKVFEGYLVPLDSTKEDFLRWKSRYVDHTHNPADWSALVRLLRIQVKNWRTKSKLERRADRDEVVSREDGGYQRCLKAIGEIKAWCDQNDARFVVFLFPAREHVEVEAEVEYRKLLAEDLSALDVTLHDLHEPWRKHWAETQQTLYLPRDRCHPNEAGHRQAAAWIAERCEALLPAN
ncbi:MAG TPA: hypothetical protein DEA08_07345 [Planctomycetes bacterium]|nr:hypothetical protein [Planctomycetota bacterium]